jgi:hypothetical protein
VSDHPEIAVTLGPCDDMRAEVFVRTAGGPAAGATLVGTLTGPRRGRDATLPTATRLVPLPEVAAAGPVSRAILTEPGFWTPELPNLYRVEARLEPFAVGGAVDTWVGLRRLGVRGRSFWLDGRRWVPRALGGGMTPAAARRVASGLVVESPGDDLLTETDELGVAVVAVLRGGDVTPARVAAIAHHPSALLAVVMDGHADPESIAALRRVKGTLQLGLAVAGQTPPPGIPDGIDFVALLFTADGVPHDGWREPPSRPIVAWRRDAVGERAACDALQRDLATWRLAVADDAAPWDWAGYLVGHELGGDTLRR